MSNNGTTVYPQQYDNWVNPTTTTLENESGFSHSSLHSQVQDGIKAIQTLLGTHSGGTSIFAKKNNGTLGSVDIYEGTLSDVELIGGTQVACKFDGGTLVDTIIGTSNVITQETMTVDKITPNGDQHLTLTSGTSKLVRIQTVRQDVTTNTYQPQTIIQYGWNYIQGDGANTRLSKDITFPVPFQSPPVVRTNFLAFCGSVPVSISNFTTTTDGVFEWRAYNIGTATFRAEFKTSSSAPGTANFIGFSWEAFGTIA